MGSIEWRILTAHPHHLQMVGGLNVVFCMYSSSGKEPYRFPRFPRVPRDPCCGRNSAHHQNSKALSQVGDDEQVSMASTLGLCKKEFSLSSSSRQTVGGVFACKQVTLTFYLESGRNIIKIEMVAWKQVLGRQRA